MWDILSDFIERNLQIAFFTSDRIEIMFITKKVYELVLSWSVQSETKK